MTLFPMGDVGYESNVTMTEDEYEDLAAVTAYLAGIGVPVFGDFWILQDMENPVCRRDFTSAASEVVTDDM